ncbi:hypothetical protein FB451DRAFT_1359085 [Mycena latifolia]|nr:hypothetical protein FB451DRAFT_1359085 [Mycena latifolia]
MDADAPDILLELDTSPPNETPSTYSPFHRMPPELLIGIIDMSYERRFFELADETTPEQELERIAKKDLLQLSQVCSLWHDVVMGTPMFWSTIVMDTTLWNSVVAPEETLLNLVVSSLNRSGGHPLVIQVAVEADHAYIIALLSHYASRWRKVYIWHNLTSFPSMAGAMGNLPLLERLELSQQSDKWTDTGVFAVAPRLTTVIFTGWAGKIPALPWDQLKRFTYTNLEPNDLINTLAILPRLSGGTRCALSVAVLDIVHPLGLPPITSNIAGLTITFTANIVEEPPADIVGAVLASLTLPCLTTLELTGEVNEPSISWHQQHFLSFASRSGLRSTLTQLEIRALIRDDELAGCLEGLPLLEHLIVSDCEEELHALLTDTLLRHLVRTSGVVPHLNFLCMTSLLHFSDAVYWEFVNSRLTPGATVPFEIKTYWLPGRVRELSEEFLDRGEELEDKGELTFTAGPDPDYVSQI